MMMPTATAIRRLQAGSKFQTYTKIHYFAKVPDAAECVLQNKSRHLVVKRKFFEHELLW
jgi:hypothetical protein